MRVPRSAAALLLALVLPMAGCSAPRQAKVPATSLVPSSATVSTHPVPTHPLTASGRHEVVVGLGDSVTAGYNCHCETFVQLYAAQLPPADGGPARAVDLGVSGATSADLLTELRSDHRTRIAVASADTVLVTTGANDLNPLLHTWLSSDCDDTCYNGAVDQVGDRITQIVHQIKTLRSGAPTRILVTGYWNVFLDGKVGRQRFGKAYLKWSDRLTRVLDDQICRSADESGARCVRLYATFKSPNGDRDPTSLLTPDGGHPNAAGHRAIAETLLAATAPLPTASPLPTGGLSSAGSPTPATSG